MTRISNPLNSCRILITRLSDMNLIHPAPSLTLQNRAKENVPHSRSRRQWIKVYDCQCVTTRHHMTERIITKRRISSRVRVNNICVIGLYTLREMSPNDGERLSGRRRGGARSIKPGGASNRKGLGTCTWPYCSSMKLEIPEVESLEHIKSFGDVNET